MKPSKITLLEKRLLWLNVRLFALSGGFLTGVMLFLATNWLVIKGGETIGPHLALLSQFFIGYSVTFPGSVIGFVYGFVVGGFAAGLVAYLYNKLAALAK